MSTFLATGLIIAAIVIALIVLTRHRDHREKMTTARPSDDLVFSMDRPAVTVPYAPPRHPVLEYQRNLDNGIHPATPGDPILIPSVAGPMGNDFYGAQRRPYGHGGGPILGQPIGVTVPMGTLKQTNERYNPDMFLYGGAFSASNRPPLARPGVDNPLGTDLPSPRGGIPSTDFFRPGGPNSPTPQTLPFYGSVDAYAPFPTIDTPWEKAGLLTSIPPQNCKGEGCTKNELLNLFRRAIAPVQDVWEYQVQDKNGFIIKLPQSFINDGDTIPHVIGKDGVGPWKAHIFVRNKYVWV